MYLPWLFRPCFEALKIVTGAKLFNRLMIIHPLCKKIAFCFVLKGITACNVKKNLPVLIDFF
jgi:hypothetical protein